MKIRERPKNLADDIACQLYFQINKQFYDHVSYSVRSFVYKKLDSKIGSQLHIELYYTLDLQLIKDLK